MKFFPTREPSLRIILGKLFLPLGRAAFATLVFVVGILAVTWPLLTTDWDWSGASLYYFSFAVWAILILLLMAIGLNLRPDRGHRDPGDS